MLGAPVCENEIPMNGYLMPVKGKGSGRLLR